MGQQRKRVHTVLRISASGEEGRSEIKEEPQRSQSVFLHPWGDGGGPPRLHEMAQSIQGVGTGSQSHECLNSEWELF